MISLNNSILDLKHTFVSFAQAAFSQESAPYLFNTDPAISEIIITDKYAIDRETAIKRPCVVFNRGSLNYMMQGLGQNGVNTAPMIHSGGFTQLYGNPGTSDVSDNLVYTDLVRCNSSFQIICKNGMDAEVISDYLLGYLIAYKEEFRTAGITKFNSYSLSEETLIKATAEMELVGVTINFSFDYQSTIYRRRSLYNLSVFDFDSDTKKFLAYKENIDYTVINNGTQIQFVETPVSTPYITYVDSITLTVYIKVLMVTTGDPNIFGISTTGIRGRYTLFNSTTLTIISNNAN